MAHHFLQRFIAFVRMHDLHHLDFIELVLADHASGIFAIGASLRAEARSMRGELDWKFVCHHDDISHGIGQGDFGGGNQIEPW